MSDMNRYHFRIMQEVRRQFLSIVDALDIIATCQLNHDSNYIFEIDGCDHTACIPFSTFANNEDVIRDICLEAILSMIRQSSERMNNE